MARRIKNRRMALICMARPLRIAYSGALYHATSRGNEKRSIFFSDDDRSHFLHILGKTVERFAWTCFAFCLMDNHYHLLIETAMANISQGMKYLNGVFSQWINQKHHRVGHLFQGRFDGRLIEKETYFLEVARYIPLNPQRAGICIDPADYRWSSYRATRGLVVAPAFLTVQPILDCFGGSREEAQDRYESFVRSGRDAKPFDNLRGQIFLGSDAFIERFQAQGNRQTGVPRVQTNLLRPALATLVQEPNGLDLAVQRGYSTREIAAFLKVHRTTIARRLCRQ
jgi:putative transposase